MKTEGRNAVLELLKTDKTIEKVMLEKGAQGTLVGVISGTLLALNLTPLTHALEALTGAELLNARIYFINFIPSEVRLADILGHSSVNTTRIYTTESGEIHRRRIQCLGLLRC